jgi:radical SAM superfamily enzyme YgiQ (UPF0313 family)
LRQFEQQVRDRLATEKGAMPKQAPFSIALAYPSPYAAGMSSLGYQRIYRAIQEAPGLACERAFLDDDAESDLAVQTRSRTYESSSALEQFPVVAFSVAYEIEIGGMVAMLEAAGIPAEREKRNASHPFVLAGGPLTFSNPVPLAAIADAVIVGEAEELIVPVLRTLEADRRAEALASIPHIFVPEVHGETLPPVAKASDAMIPAWAPIRTPNAHLSDMFLIETERGCSRGCQYCVMRRSTNGGMRLAPAETIHALVPQDAKRVGLVGAAVSDHPRIVDIVNRFADEGRDVGLSSLRPDRLSDPFVAALARAGYRTLTTAMDGPSERLRQMLERHAKEKHLVKCAERAKAHGMQRLKLYLMIGLPTETGEDIDECAKFVSELSTIVPISLGIAPFCSKRNTPLDRQPFAGIDVVDDRLDRLRRGLKGRADVRSTSAKWAWVEWVLAQGGAAAGKAAIEAARNGGSFGAYRKAFRDLPSAAKKLPLVVA